MIKALALVFVTGLTLTACGQQALEVGAVNLCGYPIEIASSDTEGKHSSFRELPEAVPTYIGSSIIDPVELYFWVRFDDLGAESEFVITKEERVGLSVDEALSLDAVVPIVGERCPPFLL